MRARLAKLLVRLVVWLLADDNAGHHVVYVNLGRKEGPRGTVLPFLAMRTPEHHTAVSFPRDDWCPAGYMRVPELVAKLAGWDVSRPYQDAEAVPGA